jgi:formyltetrahydrofolate-dependent phosphoribosylglycinamide formyltransferase
LTKKTEKIIAYTDGGSRGNPGPAAAGFILYDQNKIQLCAKALYLGETTNNVAEYTALIKALQTAQKFNPKNLSLYSDSELLVRQINGQYKVKSEQIRPLFQQALKLLEKCENWKLQHITRDKNKQADRIVNKALNLGKDIDMDSAPQTNKKLVRIGAMISGGGTTLMNILEYIKDGRLNAEVPLVISSRSTAAGVEKAKAAGLNVKIIRKKDYPDIDQFSKCIEQELVAANVDLVVQGGWLCLWKIPARYENRVMNIHPALLPSFGGQGMWGHHVHQAVINAGCKISGCTVHFCTNEYDKGPIIVQKCCPVQENDTPDSLAKRVFEQECLAYPQAIKLFAEDRLTIRDGKAKILEE